MCNDWKRWRIAAFSCWLLGLAVAVSAGILSRSALITFLIGMAVQLILVGNLCGMVWDRVQHGRTDTDIAPDLKSEAE